MTSGKGVDDLINTLIKKKVLKKGLFNHGQDIVMAFSPPVVGCLVKKRLANGGGGRSRPHLMKMVFVNSNQISYCLMVSNTPSIVLWWTSRAELMWMVPSKKENGQQKSFMQSSINIQTRLEAISSKMSLLVPIVVKFI